MAGGVETAADLESQPAGHEGLGPVDPDVVERRAVLARDLDHVGKAAVGDQRDRRSPPLEQRIGRDRRAVRQQVRALSAGEGGDAGGHRHARVDRRREHLGDSPVGGDDIGERAAGIGRQPHAGRH